MGNVFLLHIWIVCVFCCCCCVRFVFVFVNFSLHLPGYVIDIVYNLDVHIYCTETHTYHTQQYGKHSNSITITIFSAQYTQSRCGMRAFFYHTTHTHEHINIRDRTQYDTIEFVARTLFNEIYTTEILHNFFRVRIFFFVRFTVQAEEQAGAQSDVNTVSTCTGQLCASSFFFVIDGCRPYGSDWNFDIYGRFGASAQTKYHLFYV